MLCLPPVIPTNISLTVITSAALVDSINPCAIAVLLILLSILLVDNNKRGALRVGVAFISALYLTYFLLGIAIIGALTITGLANVLHKIVGGIAIIIGLLSIKDFFWYNEAEFIDKMPRAWRPTIQHVLKNPSPLAAFIIGVIITLFEFPFTGGSYAFVLGMLAQNATWAYTLAMLLYYNVIFIMPLAILATLLYFGITTAQKLTQWETDHLRVMHLIAGVVMVTLGTWILMS